MFLLSFHVAYHRWWLGSLSLMLEEESSPYEGWLWLALTSPSLAGWSW